MYAIVNQFVLWSCTQWPVESPQVPQRNTLCFYCRLPHLRWARGCATASCLRAIRIPALTPPAPSLWRSVYTLTICCQVNPVTRPARSSWPLASILTPKCQSKCPKLPRSLSLHFLDISVRGPFTGRPDKPRSPASDNDSPLQCRLFEISRLFFTWFPDKEIKLLYKIRVGLY